MARIVSNAARIADLSRFAIQHMSFRIASASQSERQKFWNESVDLGGLVGDAAQILAGAMVILDYLSLEDSGSMARRNDAVRIGSSHTLVMSASQWTPKRDDRTEALRSMDATAADNLLRLIPSGRIPTSIISEVLSEHVSMTSQESVLDPFGRRLLGGLDLDLDLDLELPDRPIDGPVLAGSIDLLSGAFGREAVDSICRDWLALIQIGLVNSSLLPNGVFVVDGRPYAPLGWSTLLAVPERLRDIVSQLIDLTAIQSPDLDDAVKFALDYVGVASDNSMVITERLAHFHDEARVLRSFPLPETESRAAGSSNQSDATLGVLVLAQFCYLIAAQRSVRSLPSGAPEDLPTESGKDVAPKEDG